MCVHCSLVCTGEKVETTFSLEKCLNKPQCLPFPESCAAEEKNVVQLSVLKGKEGPRGLLQVKAPENNVYSIRPFP